jgi:tRNA A37 threonylcarbamoyladenosine dehydratase
VFSEEPPQPPQLLAYDDGAFRCVCPGGQNGMNDCETKNRVEGSIAFVPSVFGMTMASLAVKLLCDCRCRARAMRPSLLARRSAPAGYPHQLEVW